jgi:CTP synthase
VEDLGGTMRLGSWPCLLAPGSFARRAYGSAEIHERHRHRYEFNREYEDVLTSAGLRITGETPDRTYVEICEIANHPWFLGCQFHPEFKSKPMEPHPLFKAFIGAALAERRRRDADLFADEASEEASAEAAREDAAEGVATETTPECAPEPEPVLEPRGEPQYSRAD